jgi:hypothetical protein
MDGRRRGGRRRAAIWGLAALVAAVASPTSAHAALGVASFSAAPADPTAAAHTDFGLALRFSDPGDDLRGLTIDLPAGLIGNPSAAPRCTSAQLQADACPAATRVGATSVEAGAAILPVPITAPGDVYNVVPQNGDPGRLGIVVRPLGGLSGKIVLESPVTVRDSSDYGLRSTLTDMPRTLGGIPIDVRAISLTLSGTAAAGGAFMTNPTRCTPATSVVTATSYGGATARASAAFTPTGCASVPFSPSLSTAVADPRPDAASAVSVAVTLPGDQGGRAQSHLRDTTVVLPRGFGLNPSVADGLTLCTDAQFMAGNDLPVQCPAASSIGSVLFETGVLPPLRGEVFFGTAPGDPYRLLIVAQTGSLRVKLQASVRLDPATGQITTVFRDLPQFPLRRFELTFRGGERSVLATPPTCGTYTAAATIAPWSGTAAVRPTAAVPISPGCAQPFAPTVRATPSTRRARADTALRVDIARPAGHQPLRSVVTRLPDGLLGRLLSVPFCHDEDVDRGTCPASSRIGTVEVEFGSGPRTQTLRGSVALAGPKDGALARLALSIPSRIGPIDLGTFALSAPLQLGSRDGRITITARLPAAFKGVRINVRRISLSITRRGFLFNPSGCTGRTIDALAYSASGQAAAPSSRYRVTACGRLAFRPGIDLIGPDKRRFRRTTRPPLDVDLHPRASDAALRDVTVVFPRDLQPNIDLLKRVCNPQALAQRRCPRSTRIATARATTPLIPGELEGPVYLAYDEGPQDDGRGVQLPNATVLLEGLGGLVRLRLDGRLQLRNGRLESLFSNLPDVPLTAFDLSLSRGNLIATRSLCSPSFAKAPVRIRGHNGKRRAVDARVDWAACRREPLARATMRRVGTKKPVVTVRVERAPRGGRLRRLNLRLPEQLSVRHSRKGVTVKVGRRTLSRRHWSLSRSSRTLRIRGGLGSKGATRVRVTFSRGAVRAGERTRRRARRGDLRLTFRLSARDTRRKLTSQRVYGYDEAWHAPSA